MVVGDVECVRISQPSPAAGKVPFAGDGAERAGLVEVAAERIVGERIVPPGDERASLWTN